MITNDKYNKIKILHEASCLIWFIEKHALPDAQKTQDASCMKTLEHLKKDLEKHIAELETLL